MREAVEDRPVSDLRMVPLAVAAWIGALAGFHLQPWRTFGAVALASLWILVRRRRRRPVLVLTGCVMAAAAVASLAALRAEANQQSAVAHLAAERAFATATAVVTSDPVLRSGRHEPFVILRATLTEVTGRGATVRTAVPVLVIADQRWRGVPLGSTVHLAGRLAPPDAADLAAIVSTSRAPDVVARPGPLLAGASVVREGIRDAVRGLGPDERALIPALVVGEDQGMSADLVADFQIAGLTHLSAVSGTNLTLVVGFLLIVARWVRVRARGLMVIGSLGVVGFVLLARPEPSVLRAAAMGSVALLGMAAGGRRRGGRALGVAVLVLLMLDPWLGLSLGFLLSVLATGGILFLAPPWRDALTVWMPRWLAEAIAVPLAAQLACTPAVAAISGQVSLVAVAANMLVAIVVGPATVLGLVGGLLMLVTPALGVMCGQAAGWCAWWIVTVAERSAGLPRAALEWSTSTSAVALLTLLCIVAATLAPAVLTRRLWSFGAALVMVVAVLRPIPSLAWPPKGWVMVACDVGQGDGLVLNAGHDRAVVVDTGRDAATMDRCLDGLGVRRVPVVVLTHFHADHVGGLAGVERGRALGRLEVTATREPPEGAREVEEWAADEHVPVVVPAYGATQRVGDLVWQVIAPSRRLAGDESGEEGSVANNASLVLLVDVAGIRILLAGDVEPGGQRLLARAVPGLRADVLKVPHHGSRYQDAQFLAGLGATLAVISVGADNDYGHPAATTLRLLADAGMLVRRTDVSGDIAVMVRGRRIAVESRR